MALLDNHLISRADLSPSASDDGRECGESKVIENGNTPQRVVNPEFGLLDTVGAVCAVAVSPSCSFIGAPSRQRPAITAILVSGKSFFLFSVVKIGAAQHTDHRTIYRSSGSGRAGVIVHQSLRFVR
jgi:hypothetical protein